VTVAVASGPGTFATGTLTEKAVAGVATFKDLVIDKAGTFTLSAANATDSLSSSPSAGFQVTPTAPTSENFQYLGKPGDGTSSTFIHNLYEDLLRRGEDQAGFNVWVGVLNQTGNYALIVRDFLDSPEYEQRIVNDFYQTFLNRQADPDGLQSWMRLLAAGASQESVATGIVGSPEFYADAGGTPGGFVQTLYHNLLGRAPDSPGESYWSGRTQLANGASHVGLVLDFMGSPEFERLLVDDPSIRSPFPGHAWNQVYFNGQLDGQAQDLFFAKLAGNASWEDVIVDLLDSSQFIDASVKD
jgi:hypothetical protein